MKPFIYTIVLSLLPWFSAKAQKKQQNSKLSIQSAISILRQTASGSSVSILAPRAIGQKRDLSELTNALVKGLSSGSGRVLGPAAVNECAGDSFDNSPKALAQMAVRCKTDQSLFVQLIYSSEGLEFCPRLVDAQGVLILDEAFEIKPDDPFLKLLSGAPEPTPSNKTQQPDPTIAKDPPSAATASADTPPAVPNTPKQPDSEDGFKQRRAFLATLPTGQWQIMQGGKIIGELDLALAAQDERLANQLQNHIGDLQLKRTWGIGLTVAGFLVSGLAMPMLKTDSEGQMAGGIAVGIGLAAGITGLVLWILYGEAGRVAGTAQDKTHLLSRSQAEQLIHQYNQTLQNDPPP